MCFEFHELWEVVVFSEVLVSALDLTGVGRFWEVIVGIYSHFYLVCLVQVFVVYKEDIVIAESHLVHWLSVSYQHRIHYIRIL